MSKSCWQVVPSLFWVGGRAGGWEIIIIFFMIIIITIIINIFIILLIIINIIIINIINNFGSCERRVSINSRRSAKPSSIVHHGLIKHGGNHVIAVIASHLGYPNRIDYEQETKGPQRERLTLKGVLMPPPDGSRNHESASIRRQYSNHKTEKL